MSIQSTPSLMYARAQVILPGRLSPAKRAAGRREVERRLAVRVRALQRVGIVVEGVGAARAGVEQHPQEAPVVLGAPAHVVEHHRLVQALLLEQALQHLHRHRRCPGRPRSRRRSVSPFDSGRHAELKSPSAKSDGGRSGIRPSWYCQPRQSALNSLDQVEHGQVVAELLARRVLVEVLARPPRPSGTSRPCPSRSANASSMRLSSMRRPRSMIQAWSILCSVKP